MHALKTLVAAAAASLALGACASGTASNGPMSLADGPNAGAGSAQQAQRAQPATVKVTNYNWMDVVVYAVRSTSRQRLGQVGTMETAVFRIPPSMLNGADNVRLMVDPIGSSQGYVTEALVVHDGEQVQFNVQNALQLSSILIRR